MFLKQQVCGSLRASEQVPGRLTRAGQLMLLFLSLCALTHTLNPLSPKISIPTLVLLENTWCSTREGLGFKSFPGARGRCLLKAAHRDHKDRVLTLLWQNSGALGVCHQPGSDCPHNSERVTTFTASIYRTGTDGDHTKAQPGLAPRARGLGSAQVS